MRRRGLTERGRGRSAGDGAEAGCRYPAGRRHLLGEKLEAVVGGGQAVAVRGQAGARVRLDERQRRLVLLSGHFQQELKGHAKPLRSSHPRLGTCTRTRKTNTYARSIRPTKSKYTLKMSPYISGRRRRERLVHPALNGQFDVIGIHAGLLGVRGVDLGIVDDARHIS